MLNQVDFRGPFWSCIITCFGLYRRPWLRAGRGLLAGAQCPPIPRQSQRRQIHRCSLPCLHTSPWCHWFMPHTHGCCWSRILSSCALHAGICCGETAQQLFEGQSFLCLSLPRMQLEAVAQLLRLPSLFLYDWTLPAWSTVLYPAMAALVTGGRSPATGHRAHCTGSMCVCARVCQTVSFIKSRAVPLHIP